MNVNCCNGSSNNSSHNTHFAMPIIQRYKMRQCIRMNFEWLTHMMTTTMLRSEGTCFRACHVIKQRIHRFLYYCNYIFRHWCILSSINLCRTEKRLQHWLHRSKWECKYVSILNGWMIIIIWIKCEKKETLSKVWKPNTRYRWNSSQSNQSSGTWECHTWNTHTHTTHDCVNCFIQCATNVLSIKFNVDIKIR